MRRRWRWRWVNSSEPSIIINSSSSRGTPGLGVKANAPSYSEAKPSDSVGEKTVGSDDGGGGGGGGVVVGGGGGEWYVGSGG